MSLLLSIWASYALDTPGPGEFEYNNRAQKEVRVHFFAFLHCTFPHKTPFREILAWGKVKSNFDAGWEKVFYGLFRRFMLGFYEPKMREPLRMAANVILHLSLCTSFALFALNFFQGNCVYPLFGIKRSLQLCSFFLFGRLKFIFCGLYILSRWSSLHVPMFLHTMGASAYSLCNLTKCSMHIVSKPPCLPVSDSLAFFSRPPLHRFSSKFPQHLPWVFSLLPPPSSQFTLRV